MGKVGKGIKCSVKGCKEEAVKSLSYNRANLSQSLEFESIQNKVYLCENHYKIWKKDTKEYRELERLRW